MKTNHSNLAVALVLPALLFGGCGVRDTEVDSIPGPGARSAGAEQQPPAPVPREPAENATAGINSVGRPAGSAGGNVGAPEENLPPAGVRQDTPPRRTDVPASPGPSGPDPTSLNDRKPMPNDGEQANTPGSLPLTATEAGEKR